MASDLASQSNQDIKALAHGSRCFYGIVRFPCRSTVRLPFPDFPCFYYIPYIDVRYKSFFRFKGDFFQNVGNRRFLLVKSPKLSFDRCLPGLTGIFRRYPLFSGRSLALHPLIPAKTVINGQNLVSSVRFSLSKNYPNAPVSGIIKETGVSLWRTGEKMHGMSQSS